LDLPTKATQIDCILFCRTAKSFGIYQQKQPKLTTFCSAEQQKSLEFANKRNSN
jgi:hypothetical protein